MSMSKQKIGWLRALLVLQLAWILFMITSALLTESPSKDELLFFVPLAAFPSLYAGLSYGIAVSVLFLYSWIKAGFNDSSLLRPSGRTTAITMLFVGIIPFIFFGYLVLQKKVKDSVFANCEMQAITRFNQSEKGSQLQFITACMKKDGYEPTLFGICSYSSAGSLDSYCFK